MIAYLRFTKFHWIPCRCASTAAACISSLVKFTFTFYPSNRLTATVLLLLLCSLQISQQCTRSALSLSWSVLPFINSHVFAFCPVRVVSHWQLWHKRKHFAELARVPECGCGDCVSVCLFCHHIYVACCTTSTCLLAVISFVSLPTLLAQCLRIIFLSIHLLLEYDISTST